ALATERNTQAPLIATELFNSMRGTAAERAKAFLKNDKEALALRDSLHKAAVAAVEANIDGEAVTDAEKADAKKYAASHVEKAGIIAESLDRYADESVIAAVPDGHQALLTDKAKEGFDQVVPNPKTKLDKQKSEAM